MLILPFFGRIEKAVLLLLLIQINGINLGSAYIYLLNNSTLDLSAYVLSVELNNEACIFNTKPTI